MAGKIISRRVRKKEPLRRYRCDGCGMIRRLRPGRHWHQCGAEWQMSDVVLSAAVEAGVLGALGALCAQQARGADV